MSNPKNLADLFQYKNLQYLKVYFVLYFKKITWLKELEFEFSIPKDVVKKSLEILEKENLIISKPFFDLELEEQDLFKFTNAPYIDKINNNIIVYSMLQTDINYFKLFEEELNEISKNENFQTSIQQIKNKVKSYNTLIKQFELENNKKYIFRTSKEGVLYKIKSTSYLKKLNQIKQIVSNPNKQIENKQDNNNFLTNLLSLEEEKPIKRETKIYENFENKKQFKEDIFNEEEEKEKQKENYKLFVENKKNYICNLLEIDTKEIKT